MESLSVFINESLNFPNEYIFKKRLKGKFRLILTNEKKQADILFIRLSQKFTEI